MKKIMLVFPYCVGNQINFERIIDTFEKQDYVIHIFDPITRESFFIDILPTIIKNLEEQGEKIERIVVLSNVKEIIFTWFRCYHSLVDDYIYFIDEKSVNLFNHTDENYELILYLSRFIGIEKETIKGKIYTNIHHTNYKQLFEWMMLNKNFTYFDTIENFNLNHTEKKDSIKKVYYFKRHAYSFETGDNLDDAITENVFLEGTIGSKVEMNDAFKKSLYENVYFLPYFTIELCKNADTSICNWLVDFYRNLKHQLSIDARRKICNELLLYIAYQEVEFTLKMKLLSLLVSLNVNEPLILKFIMETLKKDEKHIPYHYDILMNTLCYIDSENQPIYHHYYLDRRNALLKIARYFEKYIDIKHEGCHTTGNIAILVDQLLALNHSPTKVILDYAIHMKKFYPGYHIKIFVEDNLASYEQENVLVYFYNSIPSKNAAVEHKKYLDGTDIEIYYTDPILSKEKRTKLLLEEIHQFNPEVVFTVSDISLARVFLYEIYPIVFFSLGAMNYSTLADVYLPTYLNKHLVVEENKKYNLLNAENVHDFTPAVHVPEPVKKIRRSDYHLREDDFIMITVGNRLDVEMDEDFLDTICSYLMYHQDVKWIIVGNAELLYLKEKYKNLLGKQIIEIPYESDLAALYNICDVYINPIRRGGGYSILIAMNQGLPIVISKHPSDILNYIGPENCVEETMVHYREELRLLHENIEYRKSKGMHMKERMKIFTFENSLKELFDFFEVAKRRYAKRAAEKIKAT